MSGLERGLPREGGAGRGGGGEKGAKEAAAAAEPAVEVNGLS